MFFVFSDDNTYYLLLAANKTSAKIAKPEMPHVNSKSSKNVK